MDRHVPKRPSVIRPSSDLNVTPMIDVLLVLLVIFMAALPLSQQGLDTNVPPTSAAPGEAPPDQIVVEYTAGRHLSINQKPVELGALSAELTTIYASRRDKTLYVMADGTLRYGEIIRVIDAAKGAGVERVGIVTERMRALR